MRSSMAVLDEKVAIEKFKTYSSIVIKHFTTEIDNISVPGLKEMIKQLCALSELAF